MVGLCKLVHTWLGFAAADREPRPRWPRRCWNIRPPGDEGLRLLVADAPPEEEVDPGARGLHECACGGGLLGLCTESLGSESCDGGMSAEEVAQMEMSGAPAAEDEEQEGAEKKLRRGVRSGGRKKEKNKFPPPLGWLGGDHGRRSGFMRVERRDGRLILTEVRIERPEVFHAHREDGRLRLRRVESEGPIEAESDAATAAATQEEEEEETRGQRQSGEGIGRCQEAACGNCEVPLWWNHRFVTTA